MIKHTYITIQATYSHAHIALFRDNQCISTLSNLDAKASSHLIPYIDQLLSQNSLTINDLSFIAIDKGPGAFTSLRVAIATVNGIGFARKIPLVGIDSLEALTHGVIESIKSKATPPHPIIIALLNAYNNDIYYQITKTESGECIDKGCTKIDALLIQLQNNYPNISIICTGNGYELHQELITTTLGNDMHIHHYPQSTPSVQTIGHLGLQKFLEEKEHVYKIEPLYIKSQYFAIAPHGPKRS
jgi:tRNA threonylcarbamoyl adenosine modification protein YeaZ